MYRVVPQGAPLSRNFRVFLEQNSRVVSPWKDIPLRTEGGLHMVMEIPAQSRAKFEISKDENYNPIKQDVNSQGGLRFLVPKIPFHYGALPQTLGIGDGDPLDVVDLTPLHVDPHPPGVVGVGVVRQVRVLGGFCLIDQGEEDWKILSIDQDAALSWQSIEDVPKNTVDMVLHWFKTYKTYEGKKANEIRGAVLNSKEILEIINKAHIDFNNDLSYPICS